MPVAMNDKKGRESRKLELLKMSIEALRKTLTAHPGAPTMQEAEKLHTLKLIEAILEMEFPQR
jgi:hypothetical protein